MRLVDINVAGRDIENRMLGVPSFYRWDVVLYYQKAGHKVAPNEEDEPFFMLCAPLRAEYTSPSQRASRAWPTME